MTGILCGFELPVVDLGVTSKEGNDNFETCLHDIVCIRCLSFIGVQNRPFRRTG